MRRKRVLMSGTLIAAALALAVVTVACNGDSGSPTSPSTVTVPTVTVPTVTITGSGVSPAQITMDVGGRVRFVNNDSVNRQINSNPFPTHDDCPPINEVDLLTPGQSKMTGVLSLVGACGFHDHLTEGAAAFTGVILVGGAEPDDDAPGY